MLRGYTLTHRAGGAILQTEDTRSYAILKPPGLCEDKQEKEAHIYHIGKDGNARLLFIKEPYYDKTSYDWNANDIHTIVNYLGTAAHGYTCAMISNLYKRILSTSVPGFTLEEDASGSIYWYKAGIDRMHIERCLYATPFWEGDNEGVPCGLSMGDGCDQDLHFTAYARPWTGNIQKDLEQYFKTVTPFAKALLLDTAKGD